VIFAIPLLVESGQWTQRVDRVLVVDAPQALQVQRVMRRSGLSATEVLTIIAQQASRATRLAAAHDVLVNVGPPTRLARHAARLHAQYLHLANAYAMASAGAL
jgi:dephospho-CoA kinase